MKENTAIAARWESAPQAEEHAIEVFAPERMRLGGRSHVITARAFDGAATQGVTVVLGGDALDLVDVRGVRGWNDSACPHLAAIARVGSRVWARFIALVLAPSTVMVPPFPETNGVASLPKYRAALLARARDEIALQLVTDVIRPGTGELVITLHALDGTPLDAAPTRIRVHTAHRLRL